MAWAAGPATDCAMAISHLPLQEATLAGLSEDGAGRPCRKLPHCCYCPWPLAVGGDQGMALVPIAPPLLVTIATQSPSLPLPLSCALDGLVTPAHRPCPLLTGHSAVQSIWILCFYHIGLLYLEGELSTK